MISLAKPLFWAKSRDLWIRLLAANKHLIPGSGICSNRQLRINRLQPAEEEGFGQVVQCRRRVSNRAPR